MWPRSVERAGHAHEVGKPKDRLLEVIKREVEKKAADECVWGTSFRKPMFAKVSVWLQRKKHQLHFEAHLQCFRSCLTHKSNMVGE